MFYISINGVRIHIRDTQLQPKTIFMQTMRVLRFLYKYKCYFKAGYLDVEHRKELYIKIGWNFRVE